MTLIHERSRGIPRTISVIADNALLSGFAVGQRPVSSATIREVCRDFDLDSVVEEPRPALPALSTDAATPSADTELLVVERSAGESSPAPRPGDQATDVTLREMYGTTREPKRGMFSFLRG